MTPQNAPLNFADSPLSGLPSVTQIVISLLIMSIVIYFVLRYFYGKGILKPQFGLKKRWMQVIERLPLGVNRSLCIVRVGEKLHLIGVTENSINLLSDLTTMEAELKPLITQEKESPFS